MKAKIKKQWYGREKSDGELHKDAKYWLSEMDFIKGEMRFLDRLLGLNFIQFVNAGLEDRVNSLMRNLKEEKNAIEKIYPLVQNHNYLLMDLIKSKSVESNTNYQDTHLKLGELMDLYYEKFKLLKRELFSMVEKIAKNKDVKKLVKR